MFLSKTNSDECGFFVLWADPAKHNPSFDGFNCKPTSILLSFLVDGHTVGIVLRFWFFQRLLVDSSARELSIELSNPSYHFFVVLGCTIKVNGLVEPRAFSSFQVFVFVELQLRFDGGIDSAIR